jgi:uncharacterized protein YcfJ
LAAACSIAMPVQEAAAQDALGGAVLGGATGAIIGGAVGGGRGAAVGAIIGGTSGAIIAAQGQPRPGGYRYYRMLATSSCPTVRGPSLHRNIVP